MIMSNRFLKDNIEAFQVFRYQVELLNELYSKYKAILTSLENEYIIQKATSIKMQKDEYKFVLSKAKNNKFFTYDIVPYFVKDREDKGFITKGQEVNFDMVLIRLVKVKDFSIDFTKSRISNIKNANENINFNDDDINVKQKIKNIKFSFDEYGNAIQIKILVKKIKGADV